MSLICEARLAAVHTDRLARSVSRWRNIFAVMAAWNLNRRGQRAKTRRLYTFYFQHLSKLGCEKPSWLLNSDGVRKVAWDCSICPRADNWQPLKCGGWTHTEIILLIVSTVKLSLVSHWIMTVILLIVLCKLQCHSTCGYQKLYITKQSLLIHTMFTSS